MLPSLTKPILIGVPVALFGVPRTCELAIVVVPPEELVVELFELQAAATSRIKVVRMANVATGPRRVFARTESPSGSTMASRQS